MFAPCRAARADALRIQDVRDLGTNVIFQEAVHQLDDLGSGLHLLRRRFWVLGRQCLGFPTFEADVDPGAGVLEGIHSSYGRVAGYLKRRNLDKTSMWTFNEYAIKGKNDQIALIVPEASILFILLLEQYAYRRGNTAIEIEPEVTSSTEVHAGAMSQFMQPIELVPMAMCFPLNS